MCMPKEANDQPRMSFLRCHPPGFLRQDLFASVELTKARLGQPVRPRNVPISTSPVVRLQWPLCLAIPSPPPWVLEDQTLVLRLLWQALAHWVDYLCKPWFAFINNVFIPRALLTPYTGITHLHVAESKHNSELEKAWSLDRQLCYYTGSIDFISFSEMKLKGSVLVYDMANYQGPSTTNREIRELPGYGRAPGVPFAVAL